MGLATAFVLAFNPRAALAAAAIAVSVAYALLAGATVGGLAEAQEVLSQDLQHPDLIAARPNLGPFDPATLPDRPTTALAIHRLDGTTWYTDRLGTAPGPAEDEARAGRATGHRTGDTLPVAGLTLRVTVTTAPPAGAAPDWIGLHPATFARLGGPAPPLAHVATWTDPDAALAARLATAGYTTLHAPAAVPYFSAGADEIVRSVTVTVLASTLVVAFLAASFVNLEARARRHSLATVRLYAGTRHVQRLVAARGLLLLAVAHVAAVAATLLLLLLLGRALDQPMQPSPVRLGLTVAATFTGGLLGLLIPLRHLARRLEAADLSPDAAPKARPRLLRPTLTQWRTAIPLTLSALVLSASLGVLLGAAAIPDQLFGQQDTDVIAGRFANNPLRGQVDAFLGANLHRLPDYDAASPEAFAPTLLSGQPVMLRGVQWDRLVELDGVTLREGRAPRDAGEAVAGARLAQRLGLTVGDTHLLPAAYTPSLTAVTLVGIARAPGILDDELLASLPTARALADLPPDRVNLIRYRAAADVEGRPPLPTGIQVTRLLIQPEAPVPHETLTIVVEVANFAHEPRLRHILLTANDRPAADLWVRLEARSLAQHHVALRAPAEGLRSLTANPTVEPPPNPPAYRLDAPDRHLLNQSLTVRVTTHRDEPVSGVHITLDGDQTATDSNGQAHLRPSQAGNRTLEARGPDGRAVRPVHILAPADADRARLHVHTLQGPPEMAPGRFSATALVENLGGAPYDDRLPLRLNGEPVDATHLILPPGAQQRVPFSLTLPTGTHRVALGDHVLTVTVRTDLPSPTQARTLDELLDERLARAQGAERNRADASSAFLGQTYENLTAALTVLVLATVLHASLITLVAVRRATEERARNLGILTALGADAGTVRLRSVLEHLPLATAAALTGTLLGLGLARLAAQLGLLAGFGHALLPRTDPEFILRLAAVALGTTLLAAVLAVEAVRRRRVAGLLAEGPRRTARPDLATHLGSPR